jgi:hypothetical protein
MGRISARLGCLLLATVFGGLLPSIGQAAPPSDPSTLPDARRVPRVQIEPLPDAQASFRVDGVEFTRAYFGPGLHRPFLYPVIGPSGRSLTRMGHPLDPEGHSHHNSVWISHDSVGGESFWNDRGTGRIVHRRVVKFVEGDDRARLITANAWVGKGDVTHLIERRAITLEPLADGQSLLILDVQLEAPKLPVTIGKSSFGPIGVRMARTIGVNEGGGLIRNSQGQRNEQGPDGVFHRRAHWVDYSGPITRDAVEGITLFDHPGNPNSPASFHVRGDGWMGASLTEGEPLVIEPGRLLRLRYGLFIHSGIPPAQELDRRWEEFGRSPIADLPTK